MKISRENAVIEHNFYRRRFLKKTVLSEKISTENGIIELVFFLENAVIETCLWNCEELSNYRTGFS